MALDSLLWLSFWEKNGERVEEAGNIMNKDTSEMLYEQNIEMSHTKKPGSVVTQVENNIGCLCLIMWLLGYSYLYE